jgi:hypothetical protein
MAEEKKLFLDPIFGIWMPLMSSVVDTSLFASHSTVSFHIN